MNRRTGIIGTFDGVHRGHRALIDHARTAAPAAEIVAITFWPHPRSVVKQTEWPLLATRSERRALLTDAGVDEVVEIEFDQDLMRMSPAEFVETHLLGTANLDHAVVGENFRFGARAAGTAQTLAELMGAHGRSATIMELQADSGEPVSSTRIRAALTDGDVTHAARLLGRPYRYTGAVVRGHQRGRALGWPTANVQAQTRLVVPADGVYAGWAIGGFGRHPAAISVGTNPHFGDTQRSVEAHLLDLDRDLYGSELGIEFSARLRGQRSFDSTEELVAAIAADVAEVRRLLSTGASVR